MPQSSDSLREKFMTGSDDGIQRCVEIIEYAGGKCKDGYVLYNGNDEFVWEAIEYLACEWDWCMDVVGLDGFKIDDLLAEKQYVKNKLEEVNQKIDEARRLCVHEWDFDKDGNQFCTICKKTEFK